MAGEGLEREMPDFLDPGEILEARKWCGLSGEFDEELLAAARSIRDDRALRRLARHCKWRLYEDSESSEASDWQVLDVAMGERRGIFGLILGLAMVPHVRAFHRSLGLPEEVTRATCGQVRCFCEAYQLRHSGRVGILDPPLNWLRHYTRETYFRLGRLEYWLRDNPTSPAVYRHRASGQVVALAADGRAFSLDGYVDPEEEAAGDGWRATLSADGARVTGHPISPLGMALQHHVTLSASAWELVLGKESSVLQVHIPAGERMTPEAVADSMREAVGFFGRHFPASSPAAFVCTSWIFSNILEELLPPDSNMVRFQREVYLFPVRTKPEAGPWAIFPETPFDPLTASRKTSLQRAVLDYLSKGGRWRNGGMFMLVDDLEHFGSQHYRSAWPPPELGRANGGAR